MAEENLEQKVNAPQEKKEEKKPVSTLESVIGEFGDLFNLGVGIAAPAAGYALTGNAGVLAASTSFVAGTRGKKDSKIIRNESLSGAIFGTIAHYATLPLMYLGNLAKAAYMELFPFFGNIAYMVEDHLVKNRSFSGLLNELRNKYWRNVKKSLYTTGPIMAASAVLLPQQFMVGAVALANYIYRRFVVKPDKIEEYEDKRSLITAGASATSKLVKNLVYSPLQALYEISSSLYKTTPKPAAQLAPHPA
jgi:hypothetical protein